MKMLEVKDTTYSLHYNPLVATVKCAGSFRLGAPYEYAEMVAFFDTIVEQPPPSLVLDLRELNFLNSSGISILCKFVIGLRDHNRTALTVYGSHKFPWQSRSLKNLQRLMPNLQLIIS
jgi:hypothetical protein